jgi:hypothetical protein
MLIEIPVQMNRIDADIGSLDASLEKAPEVLDVVGVNVTAHELDRMIVSSASTSPLILTNVPVFIASRTR